MNTQETFNLIGEDILKLSGRIGNLNGLATTEKNSLVLAINEVYKKVSDIANQSGGATINDSGATANDVWSAAKITQAINDANVTVKSELIGGSPDALNAFNELAAAMNNDPSFATTVATALNNRLRFDDVQILNDTQKRQAASNLGMDDPTIDYLAEYMAARGSI